MHCALSEAGATQFCQLVMRDEEARDGKKRLEEKKEIVYCRYCNTCAACDLRLLDCRQENKGKKGERTHTYIQTVHWAPGFRDAVQVPSLQKRSPDFVISPSFRLSFLC